MHPSIYTSEEKCQCIVNLDPNHTLVLYFLFKFRTCIKMFQGHIIIQKSQIIKLHHEPIDIPVEEICALNCRLKSSISNKDCRPWRTGFLHQGNHFICNACMLIIIIINHMLCFGDFSTDDALMLCITYFRSC